MVGGGKGFVDCDDEEDCVDEGSGAAWANLPGGARSKWLISYCAGSGDGDDFFPPVGGGGGGGGAAGGGGGGGGDIGVDGGGEETHYAGGTDSE